MKFRERKERQRIQLFDRYTYFWQDATLLEIGTWDGIFATWINNIYGYRLWWYDIQDMLSTHAQLDNYQVWGDDVLLHTLDSQKFDGIIIAYTLHHMQDEQITHLLSLLQSYQIKIIILEETYSRTKSIVCLNDIISNILQYGFGKFNRRDYFQLNFKTVVNRNVLFKKAWYRSDIIGKKLRYGFLHTHAFLLDR